MFVDEIVDDAFVALVLALACLGPILTDRVTAVLESAFREDVLLGWYLLIIIINSSQPLDLVWMQVHVVLGELRGLLGISEPRENLGAHRGVEVQI